MDLDKAFEPPSKFGWTFVVLNLRIKNQTHVVAMFGQLSRQLIAIK